MTFKYDKMKKNDLFKELDLKNIYGYKTLSKCELTELLLDDNPPTNITKEYYINKIKKRQIDNFNKYMDNYVIIKVVYKVDNKGIEEKTVYQAKHKSTGKIVAIKHAINTPTSIKEFITECRIHKVLMKEQDKRYFVKYVDEYRDMYQTIFVSEFVTDAVDLEYFINNNKCNSNELLYIIKQLIEGLMILHKYLVHRDIKPKNIMITSKLKIKFIDFGTSCLITDVKELSGIVGTPKYYSPELVIHRDRLYALSNAQSKDDENRYTNLVKYYDNFLNSAKFIQIADIWSLGQVLYRLTNNGVYPNEKLNKRENLYKNANAFQIMTVEARVRESKFIPSFNPNKNINKIINGFLRYMPNERMSLEEGLAIVSQYKYMNMHHNRYMLLSIGLFIVICLSLLIYTTFF